MIPNVDDYGIDSSPEDTSEDEECPRRPIPLWARSECSALLNRFEYI
jgi:hypothetical protein